MTPLAQSGLGSSLRQRLEFEARVLDLLPVGVCVCEPPTGELWACNRRALDLWGRPTVEASRRYGGQWLRERTPAAEVLRTGVAAHGVEATVERADGAVRRLLVNLDPLRDEAGEVRSVLAVVQDVTEQQETEEALRRLNETLEQRVALGTAEAERRAAQLRALACELTQTEQRERKRLAQVLHDHLQQLLVAAKMRLGMLSPQPGETGLAKPLRRIEDLLDQSIDASRSLTVELSPPILHDGGLSAALEWLGRRVLLQHGLTVELDLDPGAEPRSENVRALLFQIVRELLFNTVKHAKVSRAFVSLERYDQEHARLMVWDRGVGFDPGRLLGHASAGERFGLFSVQQRLELLGGHFELESAPGQGTRVTLLAPLHRPEDEHESPAASASAPGAQEPCGAGAPCATCGGVRVLLADDHKILREGIAGLLREQPGIEVVGEASDGVAAVALAQRLRPDVVVMDITMPRLNGIDATRRIVAELPGVRVIGLSMHEEQDMASAMREAGATAYLNKDGPSDALVAAIRAAAPAAV